MKTEKDQLAGAYLPCPRSSLVTNHRATQQNTGPFIDISLNHKGAYSIMLRSSKDCDTCKIGGPIIAKKHQKHCFFSPNPEALRFFILTFLPGAITCRCCSIREAITDPTG